MTNFVETIKACESAAGAGTKKIILAALSQADAVTCRLIKEALDPYRVFGVRKYDLPTVYTCHAETSNAHDDYEIFFALLDDLAARALTGNDARDAVTRVLGLFSEMEAKYLARIFDKDLKAGFSADTMNKIWPGLIPTFEVMLADKCESIEEFEQEISFPCQADLKYDGERTIAIVTAASIVYYSRSGKEAVHVNGLFDQELIKIRTHLGYDFVLDGERYASNFTETMNAKKEGNDEAKNNLRFRAFFLMPLSDWIAQSTSITMKSNRVFLDQLLSAMECKKIILSEGREVQNYHDMMEYCDEAIDVLQVEGLILKDWNSTYQWDRKISWCKVKRFYDVDCRVVGTYAGRKGTRLENSLGGIQVVGFLESGERVEANVGSGFSDEDRALIDWIGQTVVIKYQEVSRAKNKAVASLRFPTYERRRDDKTVEI
jgi:hypothetical protein